MPHFKLHSDAVFDVIVNYYLNDEEVTDSDAILAQLDHEEIIYEARQGRDFQDEVDLANLEIRRQIDNLFNR
jgi:hypothetical protein